MDDGSLGRLVNDDSNPNAKMRKIVLHDLPHLCLFAIKDIKKDEEITYDYGGTGLPWRVYTKKRSKNKVCLQKFLERSRYYNDVVNDFLNVIYSMAVKLRD